ncbi:hypothetical protein [Flagellimonas marinaquae]
MLLVPVKLLANQSAEYDINQDFDQEGFDNVVFKGPNKKYVKFPQKFYPNLVEIPSKIIVKPKKQKNIRCLSLLKLGV